VTAVDLFCGAGGLSLALERAGFSVVAAYDNWQPAVETYRTNLGERIHLVDITKIDNLPQVTLVAGGPPCQGFSSAGMRRPDDQRNTLVGVFSELVCRVRPLAFIFENVEGFLTGGSGRFVFDLLRPLVKAGYRIHLRKVNAANYGVPQHRKRVVAIGGLGWDPSFPGPTHSAYGAPGAHLLASDLPPTPSLGEVLQGLPPAIPINGTGSTDSFENTYRPLDSEDLERARLLKPGQTMQDLPEELWHQSYRRRAYRRVMDGTPTERRGGAPAGLRRLRSDEPSKAITGGALNEFLHPTEDRPLTIRECARVQTFPDDFYFKGKRSEQIQLIGNAVPPLFGECFAKSIARDLCKTKPSVNEGALLSFVSTAANGTSPALQGVTKEVVKEFAPGGQKQVYFPWD
jgi:DNA (cytosine-5)-methyltransferase 1